MRNLKTFPFKRARRITAKEVIAAHKSIEVLTGKKRALRGRPPKIKSEKYRVISIRLHPQIFNWAKKEAKKRGLGYQTVINEALLQKAG